ncbi:ABC transporter substrate-binding protein [Maritimibacter sp. 55A14]|uniref:ABC transporter substrate-binding protein n=1 Tax=Maritimibacter sp. 55A14 TaxID=2174844 RepID=UPI000D610BE8|nr:ABC transporter substrate-binding protein [Maritimibacter sp. 55A14]PWE32546.1 ABC transporter substrate-binding protein [Maritimibacter sp. 55A14]
MRQIARAATLVLALLGVAWLAHAADLPVLRVAVLENGTVNWELETIRRNGLDRANGFRLEVQGMADNGGTRVAFAGDAADVVVADWIWVARQRAAGKDYVAIPYSTAVGGLVVPAGSPVRDLTDLRGGKIGIAGGPLDKSWLILRAYARRVHGMDLRAETEQVFGAPPLIYKTALRGETDGAINFWHFLARMEAAGMREVISVREAATALGLDPDTPLLVYVLKGADAEARPEVARGLYRASRAAKELLRRDDAAWQAIRPLMPAESEAEAAALRAGFLAGIPPAGPVDRDAAARLFALLADLGGADLTGQAQTPPGGLFLPVPD